MAMASNLVASLEEMHSFGLMDRKQLVLEDTTLPKRNVPWTAVLLLHAQTRTRAAEHVLVRGVGMLSISRVRHRTVVQPEKTLLFFTILRLQVLFERGHSPLLIASEGFSMGLGEARMRGSSIS